MHGQQNIKYTAIILALKENVKECIQK